MKIKKALCLVLATVMTASLASVPAMADTPTFGGVMPGVAGTEKSDAQKVLEMIPDMEYTAENVRVAVYTMGVSEDMTYAFKGMLNDDSLDFDTMASNVMMDVLAEVGVKDMADLADFIKNNTSSWQVNPISIVDPPTGTLTTTTVAIVAGNDTPASSYKVSGDANKGTTTFSAQSTISNGIKITAEDGYTLKSVHISGQNARVKTKTGNGNTQVQASDVVYFNDLVKDTNDEKNDSAQTVSDNDPTHEVTLKAADLKRKTGEITSANIGDRIYIPTFTAQGQGLFGDGNTYSGAMTITVETEPKEKGTVTVSGGPSVDSLYTFNSANYRSASALTTAIAAYIGRSDVNIGDVVSFSYNTTYIKKVDVGNDIQSNGASFEDGTVFFKVPESGKTDTTIAVTAADMSEEVIINASNTEDETVAYTFNNNVYTGIKALSEAINKAIGDNTPVGNTLTFTYTGDTISNITDTNSGSYNQAAKSFTFTTTSETNTITITFVDMSKPITVERDTSGGDEPANITYTFDNRDYHSIEELSSALSSSLTSVTVNKQYTITYDDPDNAISKIDNTNITGFNANTSTKRITFTTSTNESQKITVTFKKKAGNITFANAEDNGLPKHVTSVNVTSGTTTRSFTMADDLNTYLGSLYEGTSVNFTFFLESGYSITKCEGNDSGVAVGNALNQYNLTNTGDTLTITTESSDPRLTVLSYLFTNSDSINDKLGDDFNQYKTSNGAVAIAEVTNATELSNDALTGASITLTANNTSTNNPNMREENKSLSETFDISKDNTFAGIAFVPKNDRDNTIFNYTYSVNAALTYNSGQNNKSGQTTVTITGQPE